MSLVVINLFEHQWLALIGAFLMGAALTFIITWPWARHSGICETNAQWFAERERVHQERKAFGQFPKVD